MVDKKNTSARRGTLKKTSQASASRTVFSLSEDETYELGRTLARELKGGELVLLEGQLGLGKTVFARGMAAGLEIRPDEVSSPSYTLVNEYLGGRHTMFHVDLYRLEEPEEMGALGLEELMESGAVTVVEWGDRLPAYFRQDATTIRFHDIGEGSRRIEVLRTSGGKTVPADA